MRETTKAIVLALALSSALPAYADVVPRSGSSAGSVIARKTGEEVRFIDVSSWRGVDIHQDLLAGDVLRTNPLGNLAVLFSDNTQVRLGRNTTLVVKEIQPGGDSTFSLEEGSIWARAERGGEGVIVETAAATAAIRGTDWSMSVDSSGRTSLIVLEGVVELANEQGSVTVAQGEAASASIGQAPSKTFVVDPDDREQMLFYLAPRSGFSLMPPTTLSSSQMRTERDRVTALSEGARSGEDWLILAEVSLPYEGRAAAKAAAEQARASNLTASQKARLDLVDALIAANEKRYDEAIALFARAERGLSGSRRVTASYGSYYARSLANPDKSGRLPRRGGGGPYGALVEAFTAGFLDDIPAAVKRLEEAERQFPDDATLPAVRAQYLMLLDDRVAMKAAIERSLSLDPLHPIALEARANYRENFESDLEGALEDLVQATVVAPGSATAWNGLGLVQSSRNAMREAEAALRRAIELDPIDPVYRANLALLLIEQNRLREARAEVDRALAEDPGFDVGLVARGIINLKDSKLREAQQDMLAGTTANPAYSQGLLLLAMTYYEMGEKDAADQALDNADRLDPNDPASSSTRTAVAIEEYDSDAAIKAAQEGMRRVRARGGDFASLSANRDQGSTLNQAYRLQGLEAWGRYYGDAVFDAFSASALFDQAVGGSPTPFVNDETPGFAPTEPFTSEKSFGAVLQGYLLAPDLIASKQRGISLVQRPFFEAALGGGFTAGAADGYSADIAAQGFTVEPFPIAFTAQLARSERDEARDWTGTDGRGTANRFELGEEKIGGSIYIGANPTPHDRLIAYYVGEDSTDTVTNGLYRFPQIVTPEGFNLDSLAYQRNLDQQTHMGGAAWSHTFGYRNVASAGVFFNRVRGTEAELTGSILTFNGLELPTARIVDSTNDSGSVIGAFNHTIGVDDFTVRYGVEGGSISADTTTRTRQLVGNALTGEINDANQLDLAVGRAYVDLGYDVSPSLKIEAGAFASYISSDNDDDLLFEPRAGVAWTPFDGHLLRVGYMREGATFDAASLVPVGVVGLQSNQLAIRYGGRKDTYAARWDAEWTPNIFTSIDYQHQDVRGFSIDNPSAIDDTSVAFDRAEIDRLSATANVWLTHGFGAFGTYVYTRGEGDGRQLPFVAEHMARVGLTFVHPSKLQATIAATYVGERTSEINTRLGDYWSADASLVWEPLDKQFSLSLAGYNLLDETFEIAGETPGWGRTFVGSLKIRF